MNVQTIDITKIKPYANNPRNNDKAVRDVANSIKDFGFRQPIVVDKDMTVIAGHTRLKAAKKLHLKEVPVLIAEDLTAEQAAAYRLADNKSGEAADWDIEKLTEELNKLNNIDMTAYGFDEMDLSGIDDLHKVDNSDYSDNSADPDHYFGDERERTINAYNLQYYDAYRTDGKYQMPIIEPTQYIPKDLIGFNYVLNTDSVKEGTGVHFFLDDYMFERIWNTPEKYIEKLKAYSCVLTPDFSLYMDMPFAMKVWNTYRSRLIGQMMQDAGITVIPTLSWAEPETYDFCFDGIRKDSVVAVSTVGVMRSKAAKEIWKDGMSEAIKRLNPAAVLCYGTEIDFDFKDIKVKHIQARKW